MRIKIIFPEVKYVSEDRIIDWAFDAIWDSTPLDEQEYLTHDDFPDTKEQALFNLEQEGLVTSTTEGWIE